MKNVLHEGKMGDLVVKIVLDPDVQDPRDCDNLGVMLCRHRRYRLGDKEAATPDPKEVAVMLPLYLYDHSGITMSTKPFSCPWDSGQVGVIYVTKEKLRKEFGVKHITSSHIEKAKAQLEQEVKTYDQFLTGQCYGYTIERDGKVIDSCFGFYQNEWPDDPSGFVMRSAIEAAEAVEPVEACYV
jgi:hypothetical protein